MSRKSQHGFGHPRNVRVLGSVLVLAVVAGAAGDATAGRVGLTPTYRATLDRGDGETCTFSIEVDRVLFRLGTFAGKYKVLRMEVENFGTSPIELNPSRDAFYLHFHRHPPVTGVLDLARADAETWNRLPLDLQIPLAYPARIDPRQSREVYVFLPAPELDKLPSAINYRIYSLPDYEIRLLVAPVARD